MGYKHYWFILDEDKFNNVLIAVTTFLALLKFYAADTIIVETDGDNDTWNDTFKLLRDNYCEFTINRIKINDDDYSHLKDLINAPILDPYEGLICLKQHN